MAGGGKLGSKRRIRKVKPLVHDDVRSEINVTPLVDVCLVLLIIFMVVTPMLARGKEVPLPKTRMHSEESDKNQPIIAIDTEGRMFFDKDLVPDVTELKARIEEAWRADETGTIQGKVFVKAAKDIQYGKVYPVIIAINELGVQAVELGTNEIKEDKAE